MPTLDGNRYRCRVRNAFGQRFSNSAQLSVVGSYVWSYPMDPFWGVPADTDNYSAALGASHFISLVSSVIAGVYSGTMQSSNASAPPGVSTVSGTLAFSVFFSTVGAKSFPFSATGGAFSTPGPVSSAISLWSLDGLTNYDSDVNNVADGNFSTMFSLNVPAPGQYLIRCNFLRRGPSPGGCTVQMNAQYTLGVGDQMALLVP